MSNVWKTIREFIASTFRDLQPERDWLASWFRTDLSSTCP
jgi:hypothetical protein